MTQQTNKLRQTSKQASKQTTAYSQQPFSTSTPTLVGIVGTAGSQQALELLFRNLPDDSGMAFVVVVNLAARKVSQLPALLQKRTNMPVVVAADGVPIQGDHVYVAPAGVQLLLKGNELQLQTRLPQVKTAPAPAPAADDATLGLLDSFLHSLATAYQAEAVAILLSGTGTDGIAGLKQLQQAGGLTMVQDPEEAAHAALPRRAIKAGLATVVATAGEVARQLIQQRGVLAWSAGSGTLLPPENLEQFYTTVLAHIQAHTGHDLSHYKISTLHRRVARRMQIAGIHNTNEYAELLRTNKAEAIALFQDSLVSVTNFFRDSDAYEMLEKDCIPQLFAEKMRHDYVRVWVAGCATGEEAYSVAMQLAEYAAQAQEPPRLQVFATDLDENAIAFARRGVYPLTIAKDISPGRLERFFLKNEDGYQVRPEIREHVLFAVHDLLKDPPFSRLDLICCRNVLIYFNRDAQEKVFATFHYALSRSGYLFLGTSESVDSAPDLFAVLNKQCHLYQRRDVVSTPHRPLSAIAMLGDRTTARTNEDKAPPSRTIDELYTSWSLRRHTPPRLLVNDAYEITHLFGAAGAYLQEREGAVTQHILQRILLDLRLDLRTALYQAFSKGERTISRMLRVEINGEPQLLQLEVGPVAEPGFPAGYAEVLFVAQENTAMLDRLTAGETVETDLVLVKRMEEELMRTRERLQSIIEEYENSSQDLKTSNEELQSINEELKSTTEELETSKEELQSMNEELITVNSELNEKIDELHRSNSDLLNFIASTDVGAIFLNMRLQVTRFTPRAADLFNLIESDQGRPLSHITHKIRHSGLVQLADYIRESAQSVEETVQSEDGHWYILRLFPYRTVNDHFDGVVITFVDISDLKRAESEERQRHQQQTLAELSRQALVGNDLNALFQTVVFEVAHVLDIEFCKVLALQPDGDAMLLKAGVGWHEGLVGTAIVPIESGSQAGYTLRTQGPVVVRDLLTETRFYGPSLLTDHHVRSGISVTIFGVDGPYGVLGVHGGEPRNFAPYDVDFLQAVANTLAAAIVRRHAADELQESEAELRRYVDMLQASYDAVIVWSPQRGIEFWNRGAEVLYGYSVAEALGQTTHDLLATQHPKSFTDIMALLQKGSAWEGELVHRTKGGHTVTVSTRHQFMSGGDGEPVILEINRDITERKATEEQLQFQSNILAQVNDAVIAIDNEQRITYLNRAAATQYAVDPIAVLGHPLSTLHTYRWLDADEEATAYTALQEAGFWRGENIHVRHDGLEIDVESVVSILEEAGQPIGMLAVIRDIREQKAAERALSRSEERYRYLFETMDEGFCVVELLFNEHGTPVDYRFLESNPAFEEFTGLQQAVGRTARELVPGLEDHWFAIYGNVALTGEPIRFEQGSEAMGRWFNVYAFHIGDTDSRRVAILFNNITERKRIEEALRASEADARRNADELEAIYNSAPVGLCVLDKELRYVRINERLAVMNGLAAADHIGRTGPELFPDLANKSESMLRHILATGEAAIGVELTGELPSQPGVQRTWIESWLPLHNGDGEVVAINIVIEEITERKAAEEQLRYQAYLLENVQDAIISTDREFRIRTWNQGAVRTYGWSADEAIGQPVRHLLQTGYQNGDFTEISRLLLEEGQWQGEVVQHTKAGRSIIISNITKVLYDEAGNAIGTVAVNRDITMQKEAQRALAASEAKFATAFSSSPIILVITSLATGQLLEVNESFLQVSGYTREEALGRTTAELGLWVDETARSEGIERLRSGEVIRNGEAIFQVKDGSLRHCVFGATVVEIDGTPCVLNALADISEQKQVEQALLASESQLSLITDNVSGLISYVDHTEYYRFVNAVYEEWFAQSRQKIVGTTIRQQLDDEAYARVQPYVEQALRGERTSFENTVHYPDGNTRTVMATYVPDIDGSQVLGFYALVTDITDRKQAEERLRFLAEASSLLATSLDVDVTLANVAHAAVPGIADWCVIDLLRDDETIEGVALAHIDPHKVQWAEELRERHPIDVAAPSGAPNVIRTGVSEFYPVITDAMLEAVAKTEEELHLLHSVGYRSVMVVPLETHGTTIGAITFVLTESERHFEQSDLAMAEELARRAAAAIGNAQLYRTVQTRERELRVSEERFRAVQQATPDGFMIFESVRDETKQIVDFRWLYVNPAGEGITGRTNEYLVGKYLLEEMPGNRTEGIFDAYVTVVESGKVWQREFYYNHEGFDHWFLSTAAKAGDGFAVAFTDVTANKQAEAALRTSEERFRSAFEQAAVGMAHLTVDGHYTRVNDRLCEILGYTREELLQKRFHEVTHPADLDADLAQMERQLAGEIVHHSMEKRYIRKDGSPLWANMTASLVRDDAGEALYGIVVIEDISARKVVEEAIRELNATLEDRIAERTAELERSNHDLDQFAYVASHDLRAPLRGIDSLATWISEDAAALLPDSSKAHLAKLRGRVERMERLLEDLLTYSRVGRRDGKAELVETEALVRDIVDLLAAPAGFTVTITTAMPMIETPRAPLELVFRNLIGNAIKHHHDPANGLIEISAQEQGEFVKFTVADNGPGIEPRHQARIFNMFQTLRPRDEMEGSGMGLAIVQRAVEFRRGQIRVESTPENGAAFIFTWAKSS